VYRAQAWRVIFSRSVPPSCSTDGPRRAVSRTLARSCVPCLRAARACCCSRPVS
jgi:hypothetical protein